MGAYTDAMRAASPGAPLGAFVYADQGKARKGAVLFRVIWENYLPNMICYEPKQSVLANEGGVEVLAEVRGGSPQQTQTLRRPRRQSRRSWMR